MSTNFYQYYRNGIFENVLDNLRKLQHFSDIPAKTHNYILNMMKNEDFYKIVIGDALLSYNLARYILKAPFPEGEKVISKNPNFSLEYAENVLHDQFPLGEPAISKNVYVSYLYAENVVHGRWEQGEAAIAETDTFSYYYARDVLKGRFLDGEAAILKGPDWCIFHYAKDVLKCRWPEGEKALSKDGKKEYYKHFLTRGQRIMKWLGFIVD